MFIQRFSIVILVCVFLPYTSLANDNNTNYEKALVAFNDGKYDAAYVLAKNAIQAAPKYLPAKILMGKLLLNKKEFSAAEQEFSEAEFAGADPNLFSREWGQALLASRQFSRLISLKFESLLSEGNRLSWAYLKAEACINIEDYLCARELLNSIRKSASQRMNALNSLARISLQEDAFNNAKALLDEANKYEANNPETLRLLGQYHRIHGDLFKAQMYLEQAYDLEGASPTISRNLADIYISQGKLEQALKLSEKILTEYPQDPYVNFAFIWLKEHLGARPVDAKAFDALEASLSKLSSQAANLEPTLVYLRGLVNYVQGNFELALQDFDTYLSGDKSNVDAAFLLSKTHVALKDPAAALSVFSQYETSVLRNFQHTLFLANLYLERNKVYKANALLAQLKNGFDDHPQTALLELKSLLTKADKSLAFDALDTMFSKFSDDISVLQTYVLTNIDFARFNAADKGIDALYSVDPQNEMIPSFKIASNIKQGAFAEALALINKQIEHQGDSFDLLFNKAIALNGMNDYKRAQSILASILARRGEHLSASLALARSYMGLNQYDDAGALYLELVKKYEDDDVVRSDYIEYLISIGDFVQALNQTNRLTRQFPSAANYIVLKARLHIKLKQYDKATVEAKKLSYLANANPLLYKAQSGLYSATAEYALALEAMENLRALLPNQRQIEVDYIRVLLQNRDYEDGAKAIASLQKVYPEDIEVGLLSADLSLLQDDTASANAQYEKLLAIDVTNQVVLAKMYALVSKGFNASAFLAKLEIAIGKDSSYFYRSLKAQYHYYYGDKNIAIREYEYILTNNLMPNRSALLNRLAGLYLPDDLVSSEQYILQAYALDNGNSKVLQTFGWLRALQGKYKEALGFLREASVKDNNSNTLKYRLAYTLEKLGRKSEAISILNRILDVENVNFEDKKNAILLLQLLESN
ncbi:tetratricopeptide repeat protein [Agaribacter marinus]|uniref:PEP-CTERM system TPR-repeat lipoprotein n=1 Tax=Agaribacter marinus TaxID=1431249 RepID=A0AA37WLK1_9ALTE|nr:tetratricopeptide repeat protein [Agaribacter marinus]GLR72260.1 hypothetical protein GCM10007852_31680 [Agaribacter marinus]